MKRTRDEHKVVQFLSDYIHDTDDENKKEIEYENEFKSAIDDESNEKSTQEETSASKS